MANLFDPPSIFNLPLSLGKDLVVDFQRQVTSGFPPVAVDTAYEAGTTVSLIIDTTPPTVAVATINGFHAVVRIPSEVTDHIKSKLLWRCRVSLLDATDLVPCNGQTIRFDGKAPTA